MTFDNADNIPRILGNSPDHKKTVFGVKTVPAYAVNAFFFQLVATGILTFEWTNNKKNIGCVLSKDADGKYKYKKLSVWNGFEFQAQGHGGKEVSFESLAAHGNIRNYFASG